VSAARLIQTWQRWRASPLFWILLFAGVMRTAALWWGLPASDGWDDDGVAPRNFLVGLAETYTPGHHFAYPPLHMFVLVIPALPAVIAALFHAASLAPKDVIAEMIHVPYMTYFAVVARLVSLAFSLGTIWMVGRIGELLWGQRAGILAALALALNAGLTYYGQVTNLDGPSLFWVCLSLFYFLRVVVEHDVRPLRWAMLAAAAAMATKDQTYAAFVVALPLAAILWAATDAWPRAQAATLTRAALLWGAIALVALLAIDGALTNPHGFAGRLALLTGSASQDYAEYTNTFAGRLAVLWDMAANLPRYYPVLVLLPAAIGLVAVVRRARVNAAAGLLPALAALSFTITFNFVALRTETRFLLPQSVFLAVYIGIGADILLSLGNVRWRSLAIAFVCLAAGWAVYATIGVDAAFWHDPRYDAEAWLESHVKKGDPVEIYGLNAFLPRMPAYAAVRRVGTKPLKARNPLPGVKEVVAPYGAIEARNPRFLVVSGFWVQAYLLPAEVSAGPGRRVPKVQEVAARDVDGRGFFRALFAGRLSYRMAHRSDYFGPMDPGVNAYESLRQPVYIFERDPGGASAPIVTGRKSADRTGANPLYRHV
jgi:hypothetical protein